MLGLASWTVVDDVMLSASLQSVLCIPMLLSHVPPASVKSQNHPYLFPIHELTIQIPSSYPQDGAEPLSVQRAFAAIRRADVVVLVIDGTEGVTVQDFRVAERVAEEGRACVIW